VALARALADRPDKILALEMGGNNPLIVHDAADIAAAVHHTIHSAFLTAGQRCTCARRLILTPGESSFVDLLVEKTREMRVGAFTDSPEPFMGPVISAAAAEKVLEAQARLQALGGRSLLEMKRLPASPAMLSPGIIDMTEVRQRPDEEIFGPLLQVIGVGDFDAAIAEANRTRFGLAAGLLCDRRDLYEQFYKGIRAGVVNWNRPTTGASGALPFGGVQLSGNYRPSGFWAADYCSYPVASIEVEALKI
jgi:succinylglutamic semialdehyde dehydrogenase